MRRRPSLILLAVLVVSVVLLGIRYQSARIERARTVASTNTHRDSLGGRDSARDDSRQAADTMCFASRIGLPCDPR